MLLPAVPARADDKSVGAPQAANPAASNGTSVGNFRPPESCLKEFTPLRDEAARRAQLLKMAPGHRFAPGEACRLVHDYELAQTKMLEYAVAHASTCGIPAKITDQLKANHENTLTVMRKVCTVTWNVAPGVGSFLSASGPKQPG
ncbi:hypothetical protein [Bradyrhizobium sp. STM 3809]|uniref:hypothetical protein n=1 Tax=Bradyrhizobium sp. STM 3809 TaxID=551936 RepID=UPI001F0B5ECB|nr:hypothetical protein [Bradyrhizobium sp. STM 3809]